MKCWHIPLIPDAAIMLNRLMPDVKILSVSEAGNSAENIKMLKAEADKQKGILYVLLPYTLKDHFKKLEGAWWHPGAKKWSALDTPNNRKQLEWFLREEGYGIRYFDKSTPDSRHVLARKGKSGSQKIEPDARYERQMQLQGKSSSTIRQYKSYVSWYLSEQAGEKVDENVSERVKSFIYDHVINNRYGKAQQNGVISALKLYYLSVYNIELDTGDIPRPKKTRKLPKVISEEDFQNMVKATKNVKHKLILMLLYGCGLRRGELCLLRVEDVNFDQGLIYIQGKGDKYRVVNPGEKLLNKIEKYITSYLPTYYLFEGPGHTIYSGTSVGIIVSRAAVIAGIERRVHPHMLRHSFATEHMERGVELRLIQESLGHSSSRTTEIYTYVSRATIKKMPGLLDHMEI